MGTIQQLWIRFRLQRLCIIAVLLALPAFSQNPNNASAADTCGAKHLGQCVTDILHDQADIWTSPFRLHASDASWLLPFAGATGAALAYDSDALNQLGTD